MSRNNTGNPIGSKAFPDFEDNVRNLDEAVNSDDMTFRDRLGNTRLTLAGMSSAAGDATLAIQAAERAEAAAGSVEQNAEQIAQEAAQQAVDGVVVAVDGAVGRAEGAATRAESAAESASTSADVYPDIAAALADSDLTAGSQFQVVEGLEIVRYRKDSGSAATEVSRIYSSAGVTQGMSVAGSKIVDDYLEGDNWVSPPVSVGRPPEPGESTATGGFTRLERTPFGVAGRLAGIDLYADLPGPAYLLVLRDRGSLVYDVLYEFPVRIVPGVNRLRPGTDYDLPDVEPDWTIGFYSESPIISASNQGGAGASIPGRPSGDGVVFNAGPSLLRWVSHIYTGETVKDHVRSLSVRVADLENAGPSAIIGEPLPADTGVFTSGSNTRIFAWGVSEDAPLRAITLVASEGGLLWIKLFSAGEGANVYDLVREEAVSIPGAGEVTLVAGVDFPGDMVIPSGGAIGYYSGSVQVAYAPGGAGSSMFRAGNAVGTGISFSQSTASLQVNAVVSSPPLTEPKNRVIIDERFSDATNLLGAAAWDFSGEGALSPSGGDAILYRREYTTLDPVVVRAKFRLTDTEANFGVARVPAELFGTIGTVNCAENRLELYSYDGSTISDIRRQAPTTGLEWVIGREYWLELEHVGGVNKLTIRDTVTQAAASVQGEQGDGEPNTGRSWGNPGVIVRSGTVRVLHLQYAALVGRRPRCLFVGDSITEGFNLRAQWPDRYATRFAEDTGHPVAIGARGGSNSADLLSRAGTDIMAWRPEYVHILIGTNERGSAANLPGWRSRVTQLIAMVKSIGAEPILGTMPPNSTGMDFITAGNADIRSGLFGDDVTVVDYARALSVDNDGETINESLYLSDLTHPNAAGHAAMYGQIRASAPMLFD